MKISTRLLAFLMALLMAMSVVSSTVAEDSAPASQPVQTEEVTPTPKPTDPPATPEPTEAPTATVDAPVQATEDTNTEAPLPTEETPSLEPSSSPSAPPAGESTPVPFTRGLVNLASGVKLYSDRGLTKLWGTLQADGVAFAALDEEGRFALITYTPDGVSLLEAFAEPQAIQPLTDSEIAEYTAEYSDVTFENLPLFALVILPADDGNDSLLEQAFVEGLVTIPIGTVISTDRGLAQPVGSLLADGVVYQLPAEDKTTPLSIVYTLDGKAVLTGFVSAETAPVPLEGEALAVYLEGTASATYNDSPLLPLEIELTPTYEMLTYGFPGMPFGYVLSPEELAAKAALITNGTLRQTQEGTPGKDYVVDEVLLLTESEEYANMVAASYSATVKSFSYGLAVIKLDGFSVLEVITAAADPKARLIAVEPNYIQYFEPNHSNGGAKPDLEAATAKAAPTLQTWANYKSEPFLSSPGNIAHYTTGSNITSGYQYMHDMVGSYGAWGLTKGSSSVRVGILDSGFNATHEDLNGKITNIAQKDGTSSLSDSYGHGTHVAGIIAAQQNGKGGSGIAPGVSVLGCKVVDSSGGIPNDRIFDGLAKMRTNGAWVINMSLGGPAYSSVYEAAITQCIDAGIAVIVAAGNDGGGTNSYPANYPGVISVASVDPSRQRAPYSNYGPNVTLAAPGSFILSTWTGSTTAYRSISGTSMATPVVTGVAALYYSARGTRDLNGDGRIDAKDVTYLKSVLTGSCAKISGGVGAGIVNATTMFSKIVTKPTLSLTVGSAAYTDLKSVPTAAVLHMSAGYNGTYMVYTTNGTTPSVKNGVVVGTETNGDPAIPLTNFPLGKCTVKALSVNAQGVASGVTTYTFTIDSKNVTPTSVAVTGPKYLYPGKSATYTATLTPVSTMKVVWSVYSGSATINASTGKLTLAANATGTVTIRATVSGYPSVFAPYTINVTSSLVSQILPSATSLSLKVGTTSTLTANALLKNGTTVNLRTAMSYAVTSSNPKIVTVQDNASGWLITPVAPGKASVKLMALDGSGVSKTVAVTVTQPVTTLSIDGGTTSCIARGLKKTLKPVITPANASNKKVEWTLVSGPAEVTLSATGVLNVPAWTTLSPTTIQVRCTALDGSGKTATQTLTILSTPVTSITLTSTDPKVTKNAAGVVTGGKLFTVNLANSAYGSTHNETQLKLGYISAGPSTTAPVAWTSSNIKIATVDASGLVTAVSPGTVTITCTSLDGSGKKAAVKLSVLIPNSNIRIFPSTALVATSSPILGYGKSTKINVVYGNTYGKPSRTGVTWDFVAYNGATNITADCKALGLVKISASGALTVKKHPSYGTYYINLTATTTDDTNLTSTIRIYTQPAIKVLKTYGPTSGKLPAYSNYYLTFYFYTDNAVDRDDFTITSSNPAVAAPFDVTGYQVLYDYTGKTVTIGGKMYYLMRVCVMGYKPGSAKITVKTNDGSKKSCAFSVTVK